MIDLKKEREEFIKVYTEIYGEHDQLWQGWKKRAKLAQAEINKEREQFTEYYVDTAHLEDEITELKKEEIKYKEKHGQLVGKIHALEKKLARYENPDYVLVPRMPDPNVFEYGFCALPSYDEKRELEVDDLILAWIKMLEAVEKKDAQQDS